MYVPAVVQPLVARRKGHKIVVTKCYQVLPGNGCAKLNA